MSTEMHVLTNSYNGHRLVRYIQLPLPEKTMRVKYKSGVTPSIYGATVTPVTGMADVYDVYSANTSWASLFNGQTNLLEVIDANLTGVTTLKWAFLDCSSLTKVHLNDTTQCTNVEGMFMRCTNLSQVDLFDISNVTIAYDMFSNAGIETIPLFDTSNLEHADGMFINCSNLKTIPLLDLSKVTTTISMFAGCTSLTAIPAFNTSNVALMTSMFQNCSSLTTLPLLNTSKVTEANNVFKDCINVQSGALALYTQMSGQTTPPSKHVDCFKNCGSNTVTGLAELDQIPDYWGGNYTLFKNVTIGNQTWMAENLAIDDGGSGIYTANVSVNGVDFGTQYYYTTGAAKRIADSLDDWHLPTSGEWNTLFRWVGTASAGKRLKSTTGWNGTGNGLDTYGFSAIPVSHHQVTGIRSDGIGATARFATSGTNASVVFSYTNNSYSRITLNTAYGMSVRLVLD